MSISSQSFYREFSDRILAKAFRKVVENYAQECKVTLNEPRYWEGEWGITHRVNGEVVFGNVRNIVDTGDLRDSQRVFYLSPLSAKISWGTGIDYAAKVFYGQAIVGGGYIPGRNWISETNKNYQTIF